MVACILVALGADLPAPFLPAVAPKGGGAYHVDFSSIRQTSNSTFNVLNPSYPTALTFSYVQPLVRGLRFDLPRRQIEVAKKNLSLTDAQFRQRAIEVITNVQRSYWDLVFTLRNLQIQRESRCICVKRSIARLRWSARRALDSRATPPGEKQRPRCSKGFKSIPSHQGVRNTTRGTGRSRRDAVFLATKLKTNTPWD